MIIDYSSYISEVGTYGLNSKTVHKDLFFLEWRLCKYCNTELSQVHNKGLIDTTTLLGTNWHKSETVIKCENCGWWQHQYYSYLDGERTWEFKDWQMEINSAILREFELNSHEIPIDVLRRYLENNYEKIYDIHHKKMEELVASVFRDFYKCEVEVVGKSNDGGIDVIVINSDNPIMIQVKRRRSSLKAESVKEIRDLLGATLLKGSRNCIFVTTANRFSGEAIKSAKRSIKKSIVDTFELVDYSRFFGMIEKNKLAESAEYFSLLNLKED